MESVQIAGCSSEGVWTKPGFRRWTRQRLYDGYILDGFYVFGRGIRLVLFDRKSCTMVFDAQSYYEDDRIPMNALDALQDADRVVTGDYSDGSGTFVGTILEMVDQGEDGPWVRASCEMIGSYSSVEDVLDTSSSYPNLSDTFYGQFTDCLSELEPRIYGL